MKLKYQIATLLAPVCLSANLKAEHQGIQNTKSPNIIVIMADDLGYGQIDLGKNKFDSSKVSNNIITHRYQVDKSKAFEAAQNAMPNTKALAMEGCVFNSAFVASTTSGPSRAALMTGKYTQKFGIYNNYDVEAGVDTNQTFLPKLLQQNGYHTSIIGKWHLGKIITEKLVTQTRDYHDNGIYSCEKSQHPNNKGFDYYFGFNYHGMSYYKAKSLFRNFENVPAQGYITDEFTDEALNQIEKNKDKPFFIYLSYNAPHIPLEDMAPRKYQKFNTGNREVDNYYATLNAVDNGIGKITAKLKELKIDDNTIIIFLSDNGAVVDSPLPSNGVFKGNKGLMFQGGIHTPMFIWGKKFFNKYPEFNKNVNAIDILPTCLALANIDIPKDVDGKNIVSSMKKNKPTHKQMFWAGTQSFHWNIKNKGFWKTYEQYVKGSRTVTEFPQSIYKEYYSDAAGTVIEDNYIFHYYPKTNNYELFDMKNDPQENNNLASSKGKMVKRLKISFENWIKKMAPPISWDKEKWKTLFR